MKKENEEREIRIVLSSKRVLLSGLLAALMMFVAVTGALFMFKAFDSQPAQAEEYQAAALPTIPAVAWLFAEGYTGPGFEEWILVYNPPAESGGSGEKVRAWFRFSNASGVLGSYDVVLEPGSRQSVNVNQVLMTSFSYAGDVSVEVHGSAYSNFGIYKPIVAERALYFNYNGVWAGGSQSLGYPLQ